MKKNYFLLFFILLIIIITVSLYIIEIPSPSSIVTEVYPLDIK